MATSHQQRTGKWYPTQQMDIATPTGPPPGRLPPLEHQGNIPPPATLSDNQMPLQKQHPHLGAQQPLDVKGPSQAQRLVPQILVNDSDVDSGLIPPPPIYDHPSLYRSPVTEQNDVGSGLILMKHKRGINMVNFPW